MKNSITVILVISSLLMGGCTGKINEPEKIDNSERNKSLIIKANEELINKGNLSFADEVFTSDYSGGAGEGPESIKKYAGNMRTAFPDIQVSIDPIIAEDNMTVYLRTHTGTHQGEFMGFQPSGKKITWQTIVFSEYNEDGKVVKEWGVSDLFEVLQNQKNEEMAEE